MERLYRIMVRTVRLRGNDGVSAQQQSWCTFARLTLFPHGPCGSRHTASILQQPLRALEICSAIQHWISICASWRAPDQRVAEIELNLDLHSAFQQRRAEAFERLLIDAVRGRLTQFMRCDELEAAWEWADPIISGWCVLDEKPSPYAAGSWGPAESFALLARDGSAGSNDRGAGAAEAPAGYAGC